MAVPGTIQTYDMTVGVMLDVEPIIALLSPQDLPLQGFMSASGYSALGAEDVFEKKKEWTDEELLTRRSNLAASATTTGTVLTMAAGDGIAFGTGDIILISGEYIQVTGYGTTTDTLIVARAFGGSSALALATSALVMGVGQALAEGSDPPAARVRDRVDRFNYTQVYGPHAITVSGTENAIRKYGIATTEFDHQVVNRVKEAGIDFEQALLYGLLFAGTANGGRTMGGFANYIVSNVSGATQITDSTLLDLIEDCYDLGGNPDTVLAGFHQRRAISQINSTDIRYEQSTNVRGQRVATYVSDAGELNIILDRWAAPSDLFLYARDQASIGTLRPLHFGMLAQTGDAQKGMVVGEKTLIFRRQQHAGRMNSLV